MFEKLIKISNVILENKYFSAIKRAFINAVPVILVGAVALVITNLPIKNYNEFMSGIFGEDWTTVFDNMTSVTFSLISMYVGMQIITNLISVSDILKKYFIDSKMAALICLAGCLFLVFPKDSDSIIGALGATGLFRIMLSSLVCIKLFEFSVKLCCRRNHIIGGEYEDIDTRKAVSVLSPAFITFAALFVIRLVINMPIFYYMQNTLMDVYITNFALKFKNTLGLAVLFVTAVHGMWFFGIHGSNILEPITQIIYTPNAAENAALIEAGMEPAFIFTKQFFDIFILIGGAGCTLSLVIALLICERKSFMGKFVRTSGAISLFNINELIIYGLPIILNPIYLIPFIGVPIILTIISYTAFATGLVPFTNNPDVAWTCPIIMGGYYATGSVKGIILQLVNIIIATLCYMPFVKMARRVKVNEARKLMDNLIESFGSKRHMGYFTIDKISKEGMMAEILAQDVKNGIDNNEFSLVYQPLILKDEVVGAEALLRWKHPVYGEIPPIIVLRVCAEYGYLTDISQWVIESVFMQSKKWSNMAVLGDFDISDDFKLSVNMSPEQLRCFDFGTYMDDLVRKQKINPENIEIEIDEAVAFDASEHDLLIGLLSAGVELSVDDFSMGCGSISYLSEFRINEVKIDGEIIKTVLENPKSYEMLRSIFEVCKNMNIRCVAKMPELAEQEKVIGSLGDIIYQGYLHSKPLTPEEFEEFVENHKKNVHENIGK